MAIDVTLQIKRNGGAPQTGDVYGAVGDVIQLTAASKNWPLNPAPRWEIYDYEDSLTLPSGWTQDTDDPIKPSYFFLGSADPPTFTVPAWGRYRTRLTVNGGTAGVVTDQRTFLKVVSASGLEKMARTESGEFGGAKQQWTRSYNANLSVIDAQLSGGGTAQYYAPTGLTGATSASRYVGATTGGAPVSGTFAVGDYVIDRSGAIWVCTVAGSPGTWVAATSGVASLASGGHITATGTGTPATGAVTLGSDATPNPVVSTLCARDGSGNCAFNAVYLANGSSFDTLSTISHPAAMGGNAPTTLFQAQAGVGLGHAGGTIRFVVGAGGMPGTDTAGDFEIDVGQTVAGISQPVSLQCLGIEWLNFHKDSSGVSTAVIANSASKLRLQAGSTLVLNDGTSGTTGDTATWTLAHGGASALTWGAGVTGVTYGQSQATSGAGATTKIVPQVGATPGTNLSGNLDVDLGAAVSNVTAKQRWLSNGTVIADLYQTSAGDTTFDGGVNNLYLTSVGTCQITGTNGYVSCSTVVVGGSPYYVTWNSPSFQWLAPISATPFFECSQLASTQRVVNLCGGGTVLNTTQMPAGSGDNVIRIGNALVVPTTPCDSTGVVAYATAAQLCVFDTRGVREQLHHKGQAALVSTYINILKGANQLTYAAASTSGAIATIKATDVDAISKKPSGSVRWTLTGYDATKNGNATFVYTACIRSTNGTGLTVQGSPALVTSQNDTTNTYSGNLTVSGNDLIFTVTSNSTDSITWTVIYEAELAAAV